MEGSLRFRQVKMVDSAERLYRIHFSENILEAPLEEMVCYCSGVTKAQILDAIQAGAWSLEQLKAATGACTVAKCAELSPRKR
jgi:NAD(P)H-nitrite reductase large subunit